MVNWTEKETSKLSDFYKKGMSYSEIGELLGRSYDAVKHKVKSLQLQTTQTNSVEVTDLEKGIIKLAKRGKISVSELADSFDVGPRTIRSTVDSLKERGYVVSLDAEAVTVGHNTDNPSRRIDVAKFFGGEPKKAYLLRDGKRTEVPGFNYKFGAVADSHLGSKYERLDVLNTLYDIFEREGVKVVLHGGNYVDGEFRFNKFETKTHGFDEMIDYFLKNYPKRKGIKTFFISGDDHEGWWTQQTGIDPGRVIEERQKQYDRDDLVYLGYQEANLELETAKGKALLKLVHGGMGTSYADSYRTQKMVESFQEGEKPHVLLVGHYHKAIYHTPRGVHTLLLGCTQDQTRFMRKKELKAYVGGWLVEINQAPTGEINRFKPEWIQFWDRKFYQEKITAGDVSDLGQLIRET